MTRLRILALGVVGIVAAASPLFAHHSWPVDMSREITVKGIVTGYTWSNPHVMIDLDVKDASGKIEKWDVERPQYGAYGRERVGQDDPQDGRRDHRDRVSLLRRLEHSATAEGCDAQREGNVPLRQAVGAPERSCRDERWKEWWAKARGAQGRGSRRCSRRLLALTEAAQLLHRLF